MNLALFGATGGTGRCILRQSLPNGEHSIKALVRSPGKLQIEDPNLNIIKGNILDREDVHKTISGTEGVLCALGNSGNNPNNLHTKGSQHLISSMKDLNVDRVVILTSMGLGSSRNQIPWYGRWFTNLFLQDLMADKRRQEELIEESKLGWTIIRPGGLIDGENTGEVYKGTDSDIMAGPIARSEVARFMLDTVTSNSFLHEKPVITTKKRFDMRSMYSQIKQLFERIRTK